MPSALRAAARSSRDVQALQLSQVGRFVDDSAADDSGEARADRIHRPALAQPRDLLAQMRAMISSDGQRLEIDMRLPRARDTCGLPRVRCRPRFPTQMYRVASTPMLRPISTLLQAGFKTASAY